MRIPTDAKAWKLFAQQQTINSTIPFLMITWAQQYVAAAPTVVLASTTPIFAFLITWGITRHEPATLLKLAGAVLGLAGTAVIIGLDALGGLGGNIFAEMVILLATVSFACATIFGLRLTEYDPMVVAAGSLLFGGLLLLPAALIVDHPWTLRPTTEALVATVAMGIFSSAFGLMLFYMCLSRLGTLTTNAQGYLRIPIGVGLSVVLLGETVPSNLALGLVLVMAGVAAMTIPATATGAGSTGFAAGPEERHQRDGAKRLPSQPRVPIFPCRRQPMSTSPIDGGCTCGEVRYRMTAPPLFVHCCHCRWCQRETGASFALNAHDRSRSGRTAVRRARVVVTPSISGKGQRISRCPTCRIAVWSNYAGAGDRFRFVRVGTLDEPDRLPPDVHIFTMSKQPWVVLPPGVPAVEEFYDRTKIWSAASLARWRAATGAS